MRLFPNFESSESIPPEDFGITFLGWLVDGVISILSPYMINHSFCFLPSFSSAHHFQRIGGALSHLVPFFPLEPSSFSGNLLQDRDYLFRLRFAQCLEERGLFSIIPFVKILRKDDLCKRLHCFLFAMPRQKKRRLGPDSRYRIH